MRRALAALIVLSLIPLSPTAAAAEPEGVLTLGSVTDISPGIREGDTALARDALRNDLSGERTYFVMPDRFANGDHGNDEGRSGETGRAKTGFDPTDKGFYHGGDLAGLHQKLDYIRGMGFTALWLTPMFANQWVQGDSAAYHGYWTTDYTSLDPHFGTMAEMRSLIADAHRGGMKVFLDIVANHTADVVSHIEGRTGYVSTADKPYLDADGKPFDIHQYAGRADFPKLDAKRSFPYTPKPGTVAKKPGWLNDLTLYHNRGDSAFAGESSEQGDFFGLDDLMTEHPRVVAGMEDIFVRWIDDLDIDGYRVDTVRHVNIEFWQAFAPYVKEHAKKRGKNDFYVFGEVFDTNPAATSKYTTTGRMPATLDFAFQDGVRTFLAGQGAGQLATALVDDDRHTDADSNAHSAPTFLGNHDMGRIAGLLRRDRPGIGDGELLSRLELGNDLLYFWRGNPVVYYGDEQGFAGRGGDKLARQDMFASRTPEYAQEHLVGSGSTGARDNYDTTTPLYRRLGSLAKFLDRDTSWRSGNQVLLKAQGDVLAFGRGERNVVVANAGTRPATVEVPVPGAAYRMTWPRTGPGTGVSSGTLEVIVPALTSVVYQATTVPAAFTPEPVLHVAPPGTRADRRVELTATGITGGGMRATFAARAEGTSRWTVLGTDDAAPYRVFADLSAVPGAEAGKRVELRVVAKDDGIGADGAFVRLTRAPAPSVEDDPTKAKAIWVSRDLVVWDVPVSASDTYWLDHGERSVRLTPTSEAIPAGFPHLRGKPVFRMAGFTDEMLREKLVARHTDADGGILHRTGVQIAGVVDDRYAAAATKLAYGPMFDGANVTARLWAPTAKSFRLRLYDRPSGPPSEMVDLRRDDASGSWSGSGAWKDRYYDYEVTNWQRAVTVTDPASTALAVDSTLSQFADLTDRRTMPRGWAKEVAHGIGGAITELHVRDFSIGDTSVPAAERGTYRAFTHRDSAGMKHLAKLAEVGMDTVHLQPTYDIATIPEKRSDQARPACDLPALSATSDAQQACVAAVAARDGFNWGYDPLHFDVPEGSYATDDAQNGWARSMEYREMVQSLHANGDRVVVDVVYNHTSAAGDAPNSVLDKIVPGYYYRLNLDGTIANSTCCSNLAPENAMMGKLVVDSVVGWARRYKVDGFRFDLMGHHPKANILAVRSALDTLTVAKDGVDGRKLGIYGEGWNFGEVADNARFVQAGQANLAGTGVGTFNDRLRDAVRGGSAFDSDPRVQGLGTGLAGDLNGSPANGDVSARLRDASDLVKLGMAGNLADYRFASTAGPVVSGRDLKYNGGPAGYTGQPGEAITYVDAHDGETLYDALAYKLGPATSMADRVRMQTVALAPALLGQGKPFVLAGTEFLRSKSLDRNSYDSGDWFNGYDPVPGDNGFGRGLPPAADNSGKWPYAREALTLAKPAAGDQATAQDRMLELLRIRRSSPLFELGDARMVQRKVSFPAAEPGVIAMHIDDTAGPDVDPARRGILVVINPYPVDKQVALPGDGWRPVTTERKAGAARSVVVLER
ncbi:pullulanase-type alpha-1,6-glucosidase [Amycolatopsis sp. NPDC004378]